ncbi:hypothetical protein BDFB_014076, partial [Asbolus verrucosus]
MRVLKNNLQNLGEYADEQISQMGKQNSYQRKIIKSEIIYDQLPFLNINFVIMGFFSCILLIQIYFYCYYGTTLVEEVVPVKCLYLWLLMFFIFQSNTLITSV